MTRFASICLSLAVMATGAMAQEEAQDLAQSQQALPEKISQLRRMANQAHANGDREGFRDVVVRLHELRPNNSQYMYQYVLAHAVLGELNPAFDMMLNMQRQGLSYDFDQSPDSVNLRDKDIYSYLNELMVKAGEPLGEYTDVATLEQELGRAEAIDWDPRREVFLVGTVTDGRLLAVGRDGNVEELLRADNENGLWGIHDVVVDVARNRLWLASAATRAFSGYDVTDKGRSDLFELELDTLKLLKRYPVPVDGLPHVLGSMALSVAGDLFLADHAKPIVYMLKSGGDRLQPVFASRGLVALRGIAVNGTGDVVYAADYEMGIIRIDLSSGQAQSVAREETLNLGGIDGMEFAGGDLLVIQNGFRPQRIMRLALDTSGARVTEIAPVIVAPDGIDRPTYGTLVGDTLYFLARGMSAEGREGPRPVRIVATGISGLRNIVPPDMKRYLEKQAQQRMAPPADMKPAEAEDPDGK